MNEVGSTKHEEIGFFQVVILILSVIVLGALVLDTAFKLPPNITEILQTLDTVVCLVLLLDFGIRLYKAESKLGFLKWGWIDLVASIPNLPVLRIGRLVRILRVIRLFRALRTTHKITTLLLKNKLQTGFASIALTFFLLIMFSSIGILICEQQVPGANIKTADDAIWWSVTTITTVGYGDKYPVTPEGRYLAMGLMIAGVGFFGASSGLVASSFIGSKQKSLANDEEILTRLKNLMRKLTHWSASKGIQRANLRGSPAGQIGRCPIVANPGGTAQRICRLLSIRSAPAKLNGPAFATPATVVCFNLQSASESQEASGKSVFYTGGNHRANDSQAVSQNGERQDDFAVFGLFVITPEQIGHRPDERGKVGIAHVCM